MNQYSKKNYYYGRPFNKAEENKFIYHVLFLTTSFFTVIVRTRRVSGSLFTVYEIASPDFIDSQ